MLPPTVTMLLRRAESRVGAFLDDLTKLCGIDSGSHDVDGVNVVASWCADRLDAAGFAVERLSPPQGPGQPRTGDMVIGRRIGRVPREQGGRRLLLLAHTDTVYDRGVAAERPVVVDGDRVIGPGVTDDKGGLLTGINAVEMLAEAGEETFAELVFVCSPDEEIGSPFSRPILERLAAEADAGFCLECARENGDIVSCRKGVVELVVEITGRAAHAGVEPERGSSALLEAAHKTIALHALTGRPGEVTVNVGVMAGGSRPNVVPERARLEVDVRATSRSALAAALAEIETIAAASFVRGTSATVSWCSQHHPMERTAETVQLVALAQGVAADLGFTVTDAATGGAADANTVAAAGLPVLDGLGPIGGDDHSPAEWLALSSIAPRTALLAALLARAGVVAQGGAAAAS